MLKFWGLTTKIEYKLMNSNNDVATDEKRRRKEATKSSIDDRNE